MDGSLGTLAPPPASTTNSNAVPPAFTLTNLPPTPVSVEDVDKSGNAALE